MGDLTKESQGFSIGCLFLYKLLKTVRTSQKVAAKMLLKKVKKNPVFD